MNRIAIMGLAAALVVPAMGCAQDHAVAAGRSGQGGSGQRELNRNAQNGRGEPNAPPKANSPRRLESVTWNSVQHQLTWVISRGMKKDGVGFRATGQDKYEINMDKATMQYNGETRRFSKEEASNVHMLMDLIAKYAVDSTIWWDQGQGQKVDENGKPDPDDEDQPDEKPATPVKHDARIIHVAAAAQPLSARDLDASIRDLEQRLAALKRLQRVARETSIQPKSY